MLKGIRTWSLSVLGLAALALAVLGQTCAPPTRRSHPQAADQALSTWNWSTRPPTRSIRACW